MCPSFLHFLLWMKKRGRQKDTFSFGYRGEGEERKKERKKEEMIDHSVNYIHLKGSWHTQRHNTKRINNFFLNFFLFFFHFFLNVCKGPRKWKFLIQERVRMAHLHKFYSGLHKCIYSYIYKDARFICISMKNCVGPPCIVISIDRIKEGNLHS